MRKLEKKKQQDRKFDKTFGVIMWVLNQTLYLLELDGIRGKRGVGHTKILGRGKKGHLSLGKWSKDILKILQYIITENYWIYPFFLSKSALR